MFKTQSNGAYDQDTTYLRSKNVAIVSKSKKEHTTGRRGRTTGRRGRGWSQGANQSQQDRWSCSKLETCYSKSEAVARLVVQLVTPPIDCSRRMSRLIVRSIVGGHDWSYDRSFMATTSRTIFYDMMDLVIDLLQSVLIARPRVRPIVRWPTTSKKDRSQYATASGGRSKHYRSVARSPNHNQSYDQAIVPSGVTVALYR